MKNFSKYFLLIALFFSGVSFSHQAFACACGCGVTNVGTSSLIPNCEGGTAFLQYDYLSQGRNWHQDKKSSGHNHDQKIETQTITAGLQYMFNREWGAAIRVPYVSRYIENQPHGSSLQRNKESDVGDVRLNAIYSGFFEDMSTGITFGAKLPTGQKNSGTINRNQQIGTGSTDAIIGAYHMGKFSQSKMGYFLQVSYDHPVIIHDGYKPGEELYGATGIYYDLGKFAFAKKISPIAQIIATRKGQDSGYADPSHNRDTGYTMMYFAPGLEININQFKLYVDVQFPIYRKVYGNQLVPQNIYKTILGYNF
jgi:hypothetical protein